MEQYSSESTAQFDSAAPAQAKDVEAEPASEALAEKIREFARRVVNGESTADLFGLGDEFIDDVVGRAYQFYGAKSFDNAETLLKGVIALDRKSTRLNSSHVRISYAVFCLKKKKKKENNTRR